MTRSVAVLFALSLACLAILSACSGGASSPLQPVAAPVEQPAPDDGSGGVKQDPGAPSASGAPDQALIVYTGTLELAVDDLRGAVDQADAVVAGLGGHVASSDTTETGNQQRASVTYRIPAENWDAALAGLRAVGAKVLNESIKSEDVTGQVVDLNARIANAQASEAALQGIMDRATSINDVLDVQRELTQVRGDIESMTAQRDSLANRAALATLTVAFETAVTETKAATGDWDLGSQVDDAVASLVRIGQALASIAIWIAIVVVPVLVPVLIVVFIAIRLRRRWLRTHPRPDPNVPPPAAPAPPAPPPPPANFPNM